MKKIIVGLVVLALVVFWRGWAHAQAYTMTDRACNVWLVNPSGIAGAPVTINNTAGGVAVIPAAVRNTVCGAMVTNIGTTNPMTCAPLTYTNSATVGDIIAAGDTHVYGWEIWKGVNCFSTSGTTASVQEVGIGQTGP